MRISTWNCCRGPLAAKLAATKLLRADIVVLQECPRPSDETDQVLWFGDNPRSGLAVSATADYRLHRLPVIADVPNFTVRIGVSGPTNFSLLAAWSKPNRGYRYVEAVVRAVDLYRDLILSTPTVLIGDLNSNRVWDKTHPRDRNHSALVEILSQLGLESCYHAFSGEGQGDETKPTLYFQRNERKPYHIDYCFAPRSWIPHITNVDVGSFEQWMMLSDHRPLSVEFRPGAF